jgi:hypothetical protein
MVQDVGKNTNMKKARGQERNLSLAIGFGKIIQVYVS